MPSMVQPMRLSLITLAFVCASTSAQSLSNTQFINGITIPGNALDLSTGSDFDRRVGFFSDIYYDPNRNEWWGLSDRGPGGGTLPYETRVQRFTVDLGADGAVSNFQVASTIKFTNTGAALNGLAPSASSPGVLGNSFDPEGFVINPRNGNFIVSDEYGPSVYEFDRSGALVRQYNTPSNLIPRAGTDVNYNASPAAGSVPQLTSGREGNRGMEGLAVSPDGKYVYGMMQNGMIQDGYNAGTSTRGAYTRIIKYDTETGNAVGQYAYQLDSVGQGRGISSLVALGNDKFLVLERNNRGVGVGATLNTADKAVYEIDLSTATDVTGINLPATGPLNGAVAVAKGAKVIDLDANTLAALGNRSPEKWEGVAIGPRLANGKFIILAGTDNDYSVTQNGSNVQFDVYFRFSDADPYASSIQCPVGSTTGCFFTTGGAAATLTSAYELLPGVLHSYTADIAGYIAPVPEPEQVIMLFGGLVMLTLAVRKKTVTRARLH